MPNFIKAFKTLFTRRSHYKQTNTNTYINMISGVYQSSNYNQIWDPTKKI